VQEATEVATVSLYWTKNREGLQRYTLSQTFCPETSFNLRRELGVGVEGGRVQEGEGGGRGERKEGEG